MAVLRLRQRALPRGRQRCGKPNDLAARAEQPRRARDAQIAIEDHSPRQTWARQRVCLARIVRIAPGIDAQRGTVEVKFEVATPPPFLREDMTLSLQVTVGRRERALTLPAQSVIGAGLDAAVRRLVDGRVVQQAVRTGLRTLERVEILQGLQAGDAVLADPLSAEPGARARPARAGEAATTRAPTPAPGADAGAGAAGALGAVAGAR